MRGKTLFALLCVMALLVPGPGYAGSSEAKESTSWADLMLQENSITASVLYIPGLLIQIPVRIVDAIVNPKPASVATVPPAAHKTPH